MIDLPQPWPRNPWPTRFRTVRPSEPGYEVPGLRFVTVQSPAIGGRADLALYVPVGHEHHPDLPVVVLLHGVYGSFWNWAFTGGAHCVLDGMVGRGEVGPMALLMPSDGLAGEGTAYLRRGDADYAGWIMGDALDCAREAVPGMSGRSPVMLCGASMGAFGAMWLGAHWSDAVSAISAHSSITALSDLSAFVLDDIVADDARFDTEDLAAHLARAGAGLAPLRLDCGRDDPLFERNVLLHRRLDELGVGHTFEVFDGGHEWAYWHAHLPNSLAFFERVLQRGFAPTACVDDTAVGWAT